MMLRRRSLHVRIVRLYYGFLCHQAKPNAQVNNIDQGLNSSRYYLLYIHFKLLTMIGQKLCEKSRYLQQVTMTFDDYNYQPTNVIMQMAYQSLRLLGSEPAMLLYLWALSVEKKGLTCMYSDHATDEQSSYAQRNNCFLLCFFL